MSKKAKYWLIGGLISVILLFSAFVGGFFTGRNYYLTEEMKTAKFIFDAYHKYYYFEQGDLPHELVNGIMDEYSEYYTKEEHELITKSAQGYRKALGVAFLGNSLKIAKVLYNSPAENAGIKEGGTITKVNGQSVSTYQQFKEKATGVFSLSVDYGEGDIVYSNLQPQEFKETYVKFYDTQTEYYFSGENIQLNSKSITSVNGQVLPSDTLYIKYSSFNGIGSGKVESWESDINTSCGQFAIAMQHFKNNAKTKLILDLRGNGGGYLTILTSIVSHFINSNATTTPIIMYTKNKNGEVGDRFYSLSSKKSQYNFSQIVVLADKDTASASEALIGAMLDYDSDNLVKVVLQQNKSIYASFGKGIMQDTIVNNLSGEAIKLTVAEIFWPISNISIHGKGISKAISLYNSKIFESKDSLGEIDGLNYAINFLNN